MTGLIGSLVGAASTAVERLTGSLNPRSGSADEGGGTAAEFSALLAAMTNAPVARTQSSGSQKAMFWTGQEVATTETTEDDGGDGDESVSLAGAAAVTTALVPDAAAALAGETAAAEASASAGAAGPAKEAPGAEGVDPTRPDLDSLDAEFRARLERVIDRMKSELGHTVTIVEAQRSQARQNFLFEQGRSRPGDVVTWTRNSKHTQGLAVDVMIDGSYGNPQAYEQLAMIAAQEGLRTLGPMDPGHVELPGSQFPDATAPRLAANQPASRPRQTEGGLARVAEVARVADVAQVAQVAQVARVADVARVARVADVAQVAQPGQPLPANQSAPATQPPTQTIQSPVAAFAARGGLTNGSGNGSGSSSGNGGQQRESHSSAELELLRADPGYGRNFFSNTVNAPRVPTGADAVQRAAQILAMKDAGAAAPINHLTLRLDTPTGGEDRIRVDLRGNSLGTTLDIGNRAEAEHLATRIGDLRSSLEHHGLEADAVKIRTTSLTGADRADPGRAILGGAEATTPRDSGNSRSGNSSSDTRQAWKDAQDRRDPGNPRNRSRQEQSQGGKA